MAELVWVYLIRDRDTGYFKIGRAKDPHRRFKQLVKQDTLMPRPNDFELVEAWQAHPQDETRLHRDLAEYRVRGEWFRLDTIEPVKTFFYHNRSLSGASEQERKQARIEMMLTRPCYEDNGSMLDFAVEGWGVEF